MKTRTNKNSRTKRRQRKMSYKGGGTPVSLESLNTASKTFYDTISTAIAKQFYLNNLTPQQRNYINNIDDMVEKMKTFIGFMSVTTTSPPGAEPPASVDQPPASVDQPPASVDQPPAAVDTPPAAATPDPRAAVDQPPAAVDQPPAAIPIGGHYRRKSRRNKNRRSKRQQSRRQQSRRR